MKTFEYKGDYITLEKNYNGMYTLKWKDLKKKFIGYSEKECLSLFKDLIKKV